MKQAPEHLLELLEPIVTGLGYECVGIELDGSIRNRLLRIYIDHENGIAVGDCTKVSHQLSGVLEVEDPIAEQYQLEVSSPGLERPLFSLEHFQRFLGQHAQLRLRRLIQNRKKPRGLLVEVRDNLILLQEDDESVLEIPFDLIDRAHLIANIGTSGGKKK